MRHFQTTLSKTIDKFIDRHKYCTKGCVQHYRYEFTDIFVIKIPVRVTITSYSGLHRSSFKWKRKMEKLCKLYERNL